MFSNFRCAVFLFSRNVTAHFCAQQQHQVPTNRNRMKLSFHIIDAIMPTENCLNAHTNCLRILCCSLSND